MGVSRAKANEWIKEFFKGKSYRSIAEDTDYDHTEVRNAVRKHVQPDLENVILEDANELVYRLASNWLWGIEELHKMYEDAVERGDQKEMRSLLNDIQDWYNNLDDFLERHDIAPREPEQLEVMGEVQHWNVSDIMTEVREEDAKTQVID